MTTNGREPWHLDRRVPLALILAILGQTVAVVWFLATLSSRVDVLERDETRTEMITRQNAENIQKLQSRAAAQAEKLEAILRTVERIDRRLTRGQQ